MSFITIVILCAYSSNRNKYDKPKDLLSISDLLHIEFFYRYNVVTNSFPNNLISFTTMKSSSNV